MKMEKFVLESSPKTPRIQFDTESGQFEISGRSIPENSIEFYNPLLNWLEQHLRGVRQDITLDIKLEYFNTSSSKCLVEIFRKLEKINEKTQVTINWHYLEEDEDMLESGEDYKAIIKLPINMVMIEE